MKSFGSSLVFFLLIASNSVAQKLKKADKLIVSNLKAHTGNLGAAGDEKLFQEYISKQFHRFGFKPAGDANSWYQQFEIYDGKEILKSNYFNINNQDLELHKDYFPFAFSANKKVEGSVAIALAEDGYPWFKDLTDLVGEDDKNKSPDMLIKEKAKVAAGKGATALIIYNTSGEDLEFDSLDRSETTGIPVIYLKKNAYKKCCSDESAVLDVKLNVELRERKHLSNNIVAFADNGSDSTLVTTAAMDNNENVAALIELARLSRNIQPKKKNYLFVAWAPEKNGKHGAAYFHSHSPVNPQQINYTLSLDSVSNVMNNNDGLQLVKQSIDAIKTQSR